MLHILGAPPNGSLLFDDMLNKCKLQVCLPDFDGTIAEAAAFYREFGTHCGATYGELEKLSGVVAIGIEPLLS